MASECAEESGNDRGLQRFDVDGYRRRECCEIRDGYARGTLPLSEKVMQPSHVYHAGAIVTLADEVASAAIHGLNQWTEEEMYKKPFPYSIQISVNLLTNDPVGPLTAEANVVRRGRITVVDTVVKNIRWRGCSAHAKCPHDGRFE